MIDTPSRYYLFSRWSLRSVLVVVTLFGVYLAVFRWVPGPVVIITTFAMSAVGIIVPIRTMQVTPMVAAVIGIVAGVVSCALCCGTAAMLVAFERSPPGIIWLGGGGWATVMEAAVLGGAVGLFFGSCVSAVYLMAIAGFAFFRSKRSCSPLREE